MGAPQGQLRQGMAPHQKELLHLRFQGRSGLFNYIFIDWYQIISPQSLLGLVNFWIFWNGVCLLLEYNRRDNYNFFIDNKWYSLKFCWVLWILGFPEVGFVWIVLVYSLQIIIVVMSTISWWILNNTALIFVGSSEFLNFLKWGSFVLSLFLVFQITIVALIAATVFLRTRLHVRNESDGGIYIGALLFATIINMFNGFSELALTITRLPVIYKQRDLLFHPVWAYTVPTFLLRIPISILESTVWMVATYYTIGFAPEASRWVTVEC